MKPPIELNVIDQHGGFTSLMHSGDTLWRPGDLLRKTSKGILEAYDERSFFQLKKNVTRATYRVHGYHWPVICWFDNQTGERIA